MGFNYSALCQLRGEMKIFLSKLPKGILRNVLSGIITVAILAGLTGISKIYNVVINYQKEQVEIKREQRE